MEHIDRGDENPLEAQPGENSKAIVGSVLDDICEKVVSAAVHADPVEPNIEYDELPYNFSPDETEIDVEMAFDTLSTGILSKVDTIQLNNDMNEDKAIDDDNEEDDKKEPLSYDLEQGNRILKEIMSEANKSVNWAFMEAVDADKMGLYDYYDRIKKPMWLKKMKKKLEDREYTTMTEFASDFRLMLENCYRYNGPDHYISKRGQRLETMFEQKLSLLSRDLREKTSIAATTGQNMEERVISGTRRRKVLVPHDSTALLNQLRLEEKERERESRKQQMLDKQKEREEFEQTLQGWEDELLEQPTKDYMQTMWEIPAIGHFLFLCTAPLNLGEVMHWELERCFAMPRESLTMQTVMTSLLSTPYQRTNLDKKPLMPYRVWEEKLRVRVRQWYKIYTDNNRDIIKTLNKIGLEEKFFKVVGHKNPLEKKKYHELTFYQRVWIMKGLCDWCMETQESLRESIELQPVPEQRSYELGYDADGNTYLHFPQFCGQDVRVYRQGPIKMPKLDKPPKIPKQNFSITVAPPPPVVSPKKRKGPRKKKKKKEEPVRSSPTPRSRHSRLRQNPKQISPASALGLSDTETSMQTSDSGISENETEDGPAAKKRSLRYRKPLAFENSDNDSREATPVSFFRSRFAALERIKDTPSRESTPGPSPIPSRLTRQLKDDSSRASTPSSEVSSPSKSTGSRRGKGRGRKGRRGARNVCRKVNLDEEESNSNLPDANGSIASNDLSTDVNESSLMEDEPGTTSVAPKESCASPVAEDNSNNSVDKLSSNASSQGKVDEMEDSCSGIDDSQKTVNTNNEDTSENSYQTPMDSRNSSQGEEYEKSEKSGSSASPIVCDKYQNELEGTTEANKTDTAVPFDSYTKENGKDSDLKGEEGIGTKISIDDCKPSTSGLTSCPKLVMKEESNDSASTSPYSVSDMSADEMETALGDKTKVDTCAVKSDIKTEEDEMIVKKDENLGDDPKREIKEENDNKGDVVKSDSEKAEEKPDINGEMKSEDMKVEIKEETAEESEDEEPEVTEPEPGEFELVVANLDDLRDLIQKFAEAEPIIEKKGKKEKIIQPPPRKRCEIELYGRLAYLMSELEPWEQKLQQANKKAKVRLRKEYDSYVEEPEPKEDVWSSEEEVEASSDESDGDSSDSNSMDKNEDSRPKRSLRKRVLVEVERESLTAELPEELGISSRGRIRKRRIIPNNIEDQGMRKRKKEPDHSPSPTPNILQRSKSPATASAAVPTTAGQPQYKAVLNQLQLPANLNAAKGGFQLLSINNQMVLVSTGPQKDKNGNPVATTQPTVLAHIGGSTQPVALPLSIVTALQAQAKQQQQGQQSQSTASTAGQQALKTFIANKTIVSNAVSNTGLQNTSTALNSVAGAANITSVSASTAQSQLPVTIAAQQSATKAVDPKLLQQLYVQQGKIAVGPGTVGTSQVSAAVAPTGVGNAPRPQFYHYNNIAKLPPNVIQQLIKTNSPQQIIRVRPPAVTSTPMGAVLNPAVTTVGTGKVEAAISPSPVATTALTNLIQAGLMPQAPKVTSFVGSPPGTVTVPQSNASHIGNQPQIHNTSTESNSEHHNTTSTTTPSTQIVTVTVSPSGLITSTPNKSSQQAKMISPELIAKLEAQGVSAGKQPNIAAMIQANPGLFKSLSSPPKQKYASNVTVKSLLEKRALDNLRQKQPDGTNGKVEVSTDNVVNTTIGTEVQGNTMVPESTINQGTVLPKVSTMPLKAAVNLPPGVRLQSPTAGGTVSVAQVIQGGAIRKIQLTPQKLAEQTQARAQVVQQQPVPSSQIQTVTINPSTNVLNVQQNLTPQQLQLLQQQLAAKFGSQNVPQNIQIVQQVPAQQVESKPGNPTLSVTQTQTNKQIKVPTGTVTIQPKILVSGTPVAQKVVVKNSVQENESLIDSALKTVMTTVHTSLPTAQIKVNSPFATVTRNVTITTSAMKAPIPAVPPVEALLTSPARTVPVNVLSSSICSTPIIGAMSSTNSASNIINTAGANAIKIIPDAKNNPANIQTPLQVATQGTVVQGLGAQKNIVQMKPKGIHNVVVTQGTLQQMTSSLATTKPGNITTIKQPQTVHNLLLQQKKGTGNIKLVPVSDTVSKMTPGALPAAAQGVNVGAAVANNVNVNAVKSQLAKGVGKIPLSPKTKISSMPYVKPQTIQQIMESKAKASSTNKAPLAAATPIRPTVVVPGTVPGAPVRIVQASTTLASPPQVVASTASAATGNNTVLSPSAGSTMTTVMATIGGKTVQLRVAVAPGQNINQILQSPQLQQQLQQLQQSALASGGGKLTTAQVAVSQQPVPTVHSVIQQETVKPGSKTIRALTNMNQNQQTSIASPVIQSGVVRPIVNTKVPVPPQVLSAKAAAPRATLTTNQTLLASSAVPIMQTQPATQLTAERSNTVQQVVAPAANLGQGKVMLVNVGGQIMAAQNVGGRTVLTPQGVSVVGQNVAGVAQSIPTQIITNTQQKIISTPQAMGTIGVQPIQTQPIVVNGQNSVQYVESQSGQITNPVLAPANIMNNVVVSNVNVSLQSAVSTSVPAGELMMVGSGLMPVPTSQQTSIATFMNPSTGTQFIQSLPSPTFRHSMPQQIHISRQTVAMAAPQIAAAPQASSPAGAPGGLEQLALAAAQVQEAMQHQHVGAPLKPGVNGNQGSNQLQANNVAQTGNEYAALPNGTCTSLP